jgi:hypothetical protein
VSICFSQVVAKVHLWDVIGGDPNNPDCSSFGGSMRRMWHDTPGEVLFPEIDPSIRDPSEPVVGAMLIASGDGISRAQWACTFESSRANFFCPLCDVHKSDRAKYHDFIRNPGEA